MAILRFAVCCLPTSILMAIGIILAIIMVSYLRDGAPLANPQQYVRPPYVVPAFDFGGDNVLKEGASLLQKENASISLDGFYLPFVIPFFVNNPNWFSAEFSKIQADVAYAPTNTQFGEGKLEGTKIQSYHTSQVNFPFNVK